MELLGGAMAERERICWRESVRCGSVTPPPSESRRLFFCGGGRGGESASAQIWLFYCYGRLKKPALFYFFQPRNRPLFLWV